MPPNKKGGKNYKKGKHTDDEPIVYDLLPGQMYGRILKLLGGCNVLVYCNDNRERLCHIRGNMRKKVWLSTGDIVLISLREMGVEDRGDICAKYDQKIIYKLREKDKTINEKLFTLIEKTDGGATKSGNIPANEDDFGFVFEERENVMEEREKAIESESDNEMRPANRAAQKKAMMMGDNDDDSDIDIDNI